MIETNTVKTISKIKEKNIYNNNRKKMIQMTMNSAFVCMCMRREGVKNFK